MKKRLIAILVILSFLACNEQVKPFIEACTLPAISGLFVDGDLGAGPNHHAVAMAGLKDTLQLRFENEILLFEKEDMRNFPPKGATLFIGSSSIRLWRTLAEDIPGIEFINRGFGGSQTDEVLYYFDRIVAPYHPKNIVYFAGTNDLAAGRTPEETVADVEAFIVRSNAWFPDVKIYILSITIAVSRKHLHESYDQANRLLQQMLEKYDNAIYVDVTTPGLTVDGRPRPEIYTSDSLHLNRMGYAMWGDVLRPLLTGKD